MVRLAVFCDRSSVTLIRAIFTLLLFTGSISVLLVKPSGRVALLELGGAGHFPPDMLTFN